MSYLRGQRVRFEAEFQNLSGVPTDPTVVTCRVEDETGIPAAYVYGVNAQVVKTATGYYYIEVDLDAAGTWSVRWEGAGALVTAAETSVTVEAGVFV